MTTPRTIAHILPWPSPGGTEHGVLRLARAIDSSRFRSVAFCLPDAAPVRELFERAGISCTVYEPAAHSYTRAMPFVRASLALASELKRQNADLVHCGDLLAAYYAALGGWFAGVPVVCHIRGRFETMSRRDRSFLWPVRKFVFVSRNTWDRFGHHVPSSRGVVVYDGIEPASTGDAAANRARLCRELQIREDAAIVGMFARVAPPKDYTTLAKAAVVVLKAIPHARFLIVGDYASNDVHRAYYADVKRVLDECGVSAAFVFTGYRHDVPELMSAIDVFVLSTHWEGLPLVILEAMAAGKSVVATNVDGVPEAVRDGETGLLFPREDHAALAGHVVRLLEDPSLAARMGDAGRTRVQTAFSVRQFGQSMNAVYDSVLGR